MSDPGDEVMYEGEDLEEEQGCLHGVPWHEECWNCQLEEDALEP